MRVLQKLLGKEDESAIIKETYDDISGFLTPDDMQKLRDAKARYKSPLRKDTYKNWVCRECSHSSFFKTLRCPLCAAVAIDEVTRPTHRLSPGIQGL